MWNKLRHWLFTFNLTFLLVFNLFFIILAVLAVTAGAGWLAVQMGWLDWGMLLNPSAVMILVYATSILIGISVVVMIQKVILNPVRSMVQAMKQLEQGNFAVRISCKGWMRPLELREFTQAFNAAAKELGSTEMLRKDFINNFSHEFKTPITSLGGFADLLLEDPDMPKEERREYLTIIRDESSRLASLANSVLALSRLESQTVLTDTAPFSLAEQLRQSALMMQQKWSRKKRVELAVELAPEDECLYTGNGALLQEVWVNLLDNAMKFSPEGGVVTLTLCKRGSTAEVTVTDQGPGMSPEVQKRIFDRFYQGDASHKTEGNGLGLAMADKIVQLHGGSILVKSRPGQGSSFTVCLPDKNGQ